MKQDQDRDSSPSKSPEAPRSGAFETWISETDRLHEEVMQDHNLDRKVKELIALGVAVHARCNTSMAYHVHNALEAGATHAEISEAVSVAVFTSGEPVTIDSLQLLKGLLREDSGDLLAYLQRKTLTRAGHPYMPPD